MTPTLGERLRALRVERGLSQAELAGDLVSPSYVSLIESGRRSPERVVLDGLAHRLGCTTVYLESGVEPTEVAERRLRLQFAEIALANGALDEAHLRFTELTAVAETEIRNSSIWGLVRTEEARGSLGAALNHVEALIELARAGEPGTPGLLSLHMRRCRLFYLAGDFSRSIEVGEDALREVRDLGLAGSEEEIRLASTLVFSYWGRGDLFSAQHLAQRVIERAERLGSRTAQGSAYWNACLVAEARGELALALDLAGKTLALMAESSRFRSLAEMRVTYAWLLLRCDPPRLDEAEGLLATAHDVMADLALGPNLASCETEMARCALLRADYGAAVRLAEQAGSRFADANSAERQNAHAVGGLARILSGQVEDGVAAVSSAACQLEDMGSRLEAARVWRELAEALIQLDRTGDAVAALRRAADCAGARSSSIRPGAVPSQLAAVATGLASSDA